MPNYVRNILRFSDNKTTIEQMLLSVKGQNQFDFNKIIPMPEELNIKNGSITANSLEYYKYTITGKMTDKLFAVYKMNNKNEPIDKCFNRLLKEKLFNKDLGKTAYGNIKKYGYTDWYYWCIDKWGTKWNSMDVSDANGNISFATAWNAPVPVLEKLTAGYPAVEIHHLWADEDIGVNTGDYIYKNGLIARSFEPVAYSNDAYEIYETCWGKSDCLTLDKNGYYIRLSCETCHKCQ